MGDVPLNLIFDLPQQPQRVHCLGFELSPWVGHNYGRSISYSPRIDASKLLVGRGLP